MNVIERNFFRLIKAGAFEQNEPLEPMSAWKWQQVYSMALSQAVLGVAYDGIEKYIEEGVVVLPLKQKLTWIGSVKTNEKMNQKLNESLVDIFSIFKKMNLRPILLKGQGLASLYPTPLHRSCGDIDIFFPFPHLAEKADEWAKANGTNLDDTDYKHLEYTWNDVCIENHTIMQVLMNKGLNKKLQKIIGTEIRCCDSEYVLINDERIETLPPTLNLLLLVMHITHHLINEGIGLKQFVDLAMFLRKKGDRVDFVKFEIWLKSLKMTHIAQIIGSILIKLFDFTIDEIPFVSYYEDKATEIVVKDIFIGGNMGKKTFSFKNDDISYMKRKSHAMLIHLSRSIKYFNFYPREINSNFWSKFAHSIIDVEE